MIVTAYPSSNVTRDEFTRAGHEFTTSDLCGIDFDLRLSRSRSKHNRRKDKSGNDGRAAHEHAPFRGRAKTTTRSSTNNRYDLGTANPGVLAAIASRSSFLMGELLFG